MKPKILLLPVLLLVGVGCEPTFTCVEHEYRISHYANTTGWGGGRTFLGYNLTDDEARKLAGDSAVLERSTEERCKTWK